MRGYLAFMQKELLENWRTYKIFLMIIVFSFLGILNPLTAKLTPALLEYLMTTMPNEMSITVGKTTALDSWVQFYKNIPQLGLFVLVILFSGTITNELSKNTLINMLTKGLPRSTVILSKCTIISIIWTISFLLCYLITYGYTKLLWEEPVVYTLFGAFCLWLFGLLLISVLILGGVLVQNSYGNLLFTGAFVMLLFISNFLPTLQQYNPLFLLTKPIELLSQNKNTSDFLSAILATIFLTILFYFLSILAFRKKQLK